MTATEAKIETPEKVLCGGTKRNGKPCELPAGFGTNHVGTGRCKFHLGSTKNHEAKGARDLATAFVVGQLGAQVPIEPLDAAVKAVELAHGSVEYWRTMILDAIENGGDPPPYLSDNYRLALSDLARMTDAANRAGVADRLATMDERFIEQVTLAFEESLQAIKIEAKERAKVVKLFAARLRPLEGRELGRAADS